MEVKPIRIYGCPKSTRTPEKAKTLKLESSTYGQRRQSPRLHETSTSPSNKYNVGRKEAEERKANAKQKESIDNVKDKRTYCLNDHLHTPQAEHYVKTPQQSYQSTEEYMRELKNLEDCWNKDFSPELKHTPRHLRWRDKEENDDLSSDKNKPVEPSKSTSSSRLSQFQNETKKSSDPGSKREIDLKTFSSGELKTSRAKAEGSVSKRKSQRIEINKNPNSKQRTKRAILFYDSHADTRSLHQDKISANYNACQQSNSNTSDRKKLRKNGDQTKVEAYITEKCHNSNEQLTSLAVKVKRSNRWNDDGEYYQYKRRKKLRSEISKEELWDGFPLNVCFKRQSLKPKPSKCIELSGNYKMENKTHVCDPNEVSFDEPNKSGNASNDINFSEMSMATKDNTNLDGEVDMDKLSNDTNIAHIDARVPVYEFHQNHVIINASLNKTRILYGDSGMSASEEDALLADSKLNLSQSVASAVDEIDSATEMRLLREDSQTIYTAAKYAKTNLTNFPGNVDETLLDKKDCTLSFDNCVKNNLNKRVKICESSKCNFYCHTKNSGVDILVDTNESNVLVKESTTESKDNFHSNQNNMPSTVEEVKEKSIKCAETYTCSCSIHKGNTTYIVKGETIDILTKVENCGVNIGYKSEETMSHDATDKNVYGESVVEDISYCDGKTNIAMGGIEKSSSTSHKQFHTMPTVCEQFQESEIKSELQVLSAQEEQMQDSIQRKTPSKKRKRQGTDVITPKRSARLQEKSMKTPLKDEFCAFTRIKTNDQSIKKETATSSRNHPDSLLNAENNNADELHMNNPTVHYDADFPVPSALNDESISKRNNTTSQNTRVQTVMIDSVPQEIELDIKASERMPKDYNCQLGELKRSQEETVLSERLNVPITHVTIASSKKKRHTSLLEMNKEAVESHSKLCTVQVVTRNRSSKLCEECNKEGFSLDNNKMNETVSQCIMKEGESKRKTISKNEQKRSTSEARLNVNETENTVSEPKEVNDSAIENMTKNTYSKSKLCNMHYKSNSKKDGDTISLKHNDCKERLDRFPTRTPSNNSCQIDDISRYSEQKPSKTNKRKVKEEKKFLHKPLQFDKDFQTHNMEVNQKDIPERVLRHKMYSMMQMFRENLSKDNSRNQQSNENKSNQLNYSIKDRSEVVKHNVNVPKRSKLECSGSVLLHSDVLYHGNEMSSATLSGLPESNASNSNIKELCDAELLQLVVAEGADDNESSRQRSSIRSSKTTQRVTSTRNTTCATSSKIKAELPKEWSSSKRRSTNIFNNFCELFPDIIPKTNCADKDKEKTYPPILLKSSLSSSSNVNDKAVANYKSSNRYKGPKNPNKPCKLKATSNKQNNPKVAPSYLCLISDSDYDSDMGSEYLITESRSDHSYSASSCDVSAGNSDTKRAPEIKRRIKMKYPFKSRSKNSFIREKLNFSSRDQSMKMKRTDTKAQVSSCDKSNTSSTSSGNMEQNKLVEAKLQRMSGVLDKRKSKRTPRKTSKGRKDDRCQISGTKQSSHTSSTRRKSNEKKAKDADDMYNSMLEKHACVLWSSEHRRHYQLTRPDATPAEVDQLLRKDWETLSLREKLRYLERARYVLRDENKPTKENKKKANANDPPNQIKTEERSQKPASRMMVKFLAMSPAVQLTEIKKWLHFYHEVSPDEYALVMTRFKQALKDKKSKFKSYDEEANRFSDSYDSTNDGQAKYRRLLFEKMLESREKIMNLFTEKKAIQKKFLLDNFNSTVKKLIAGEDVVFVRGIKSERLTEVLNDLRSLETARKIGVSGEPIGTKSFENLSDQIFSSHYWDNSLYTSLHQDACDVFENHPSEDIDLLNQFLLETDSSEVPNVDLDTIEALLRVEDNCRSESPRCIFFQNVTYPNQDDMGHCRSFQGMRPIYSNAESTFNNCCPSSILTDWIVSDYMTAIENQDGRLRPNERSGEWTVLARDSPWQVALNHKHDLVSQSLGGYTRYPFYLTISSTTVQDFMRQPSPRMQDQNISHNYIAEKSNSNTSLSDSELERLVSSKQKDRELQVAWSDDTRWIHGSQSIQVENSVYKRPVIKIDSSKMELGSSIISPVSDITK